MIKKEKWKCIKHTHKKYYISSHGRIMSVKYNKVRFLKPAPDPEGYLIFVISVDGRRLARKGHRLVAEYFIPNPLFKRLVNHKDKNTSNNYVGNLEWVTNRENVLHGLGKEYR